MTNYLDSSSKKNEYISESYENTNALSDFKQRIDGRGRTEYPFLDDRYSPRSRVPCTDLIPFFADRIKEGDLLSIKKVMRGVLEANPGMAPDPSWVDSRVERAASVDISQYFNKITNNALFEIKAFFIVVSKDGGGREFGITEDYPQLLAWVLCPYTPDWSDQMSELRQRANSFIKEMRSKGSGYWENYPLFGESDEDAIPPEHDRVLAKIRTLSPAARMHLLYAVSRLKPGDIWNERGGNKITDMTNYEIRKFGIHIPETSQEILSTNILVPSFEKKAYMHFMTKDELFKTSKECNADCRKSWRKSRILEGIIDHSPEYMNNKMEDKGVVCINPEFKREIIDVDKYSENLSKTCKLLFFA